MSSLVIAAAPAIHRNLLIALLSFAAGAWTAARISSQQDHVSHGREHHAATEHQKLTPIPIAASPKEISTQSSSADCPSEGIIFQLDPTHYVLRSQSIAQLATCIDRAFFRFGQRRDDFFSIKDNRVNNLKLININTGSWPALLGIQSGDLIDQIDGLSLDLELFKKACLKLQHKFTQGKLFTIKLSMIRQNHRFNITYYVVP